MCEQGELAWSGEDKEFSFLAVVSLVCYLALELCEHEGREKCRRLFSKECLANSTGIVEAI